MLRESRASIQQGHDKAFCCPPRTPSPRPHSPGHGVERFASLDGCHCVRVESQAKARLNIAKHNGQTGSHETKNVRVDDCCTRDDKQICSEARITYQNRRRTHQFFNFQAIAGHLKGGAQM